MSQAESSLAGASAAIMAAGGYFLQFQKLQAKSLSCFFLFFFNSNSGHRMQQCQGSHFGDHSKG